MNQNNDSKEVNELLRILRERANQENKRTQPTLRNIKQPSSYLEYTEKILSPEGMLTNTTSQFCTTCHRAVEEAQFICHECQRIVCPECIVWNNRVVHCEECIRRTHLDLKKADYYTLVSLDNDINETETIAELSFFSEEEIEDSISGLLTKGLILKETKFLGFLQNYKLTRKGKDGIDIYRQIYGKQEDVVPFGQNMRAFLKDGTTNGGDVHDVRH